VESRQSRRAPASEQFESGLCISVADTWYGLAARVNPIVRAQTDRARLASAKLWAEKVNKETLAGFPDDRSVKPEELVKFALAVHDLLEKKFNREPIAAEVSRLISMRGTCSVKDCDDQHLAVIEDEREFWALEYRLLFKDLARGRTRDDWRNAVSRCPNTKCHRFFMKQRGDQIFCSDRCRMAQRNREAYVSVKARAHRRGKQ
jgi:hypothetical protein